MPAFARTEGGAGCWLKPGAFSYTRFASSLSSTCDGTGQITDTQFLPHRDIECTDCRGSCYGAQTPQIRRDGLSLPDTMAMSVNRPVRACVG